MHSTLFYVHLSWISIFHRLDLSIIDKQSSIYSKIIMKIKMFDFQRFKRFSWIHILIVVTSLNFLWKLNCSNSNYFNRMLIIVTSSNLIWKLEKKNFFFSILRFLRILINFFNSFIRCRCNIDIFSFFDRRWKRNWNHRIVCKFIVINEFIVKLIEWRKHYHVLNWKKLIWKHLNFENEINENCIFEFKWIFFCKTNLLFYFSISFFFDLFEISNDRFLILIFRELCICNKKFEKNAFSFNICVHTSNFV